MMMHPSMSQDANDELIQMLDDNDANDTGDGGTSYAEGEGYNCDVSFKDGMKEVELKCLCCVMRMKLRVE
jgi:hypothetical protein